MRTTKPVIIHTNFGLSYRRARAKNRIRASIRTLLGLLRKSALAKAVSRPIRYFKVSSFLETLKLDSTSSSSIEQIAAKNTENTRAPSEGENGSMFLAFRRR